MNSCDFIREVRSDPGLNRTACIMTGEQKSENVIAAKKAGVSSYVVKPFNAQTLKAKIEAALAMRTATFLGRDQAVGESQPPQSSKAGASVATPASATLKCRGIFTGSL
jgi:DNA-binding response OmpR family regulator